MKQEDNELFLKDLCARLPYMVKGDAKGIIQYILNVPIDMEPEVLTNIDLDTNTYGVSRQRGIPLYNRKGEINFKPYLFPLSSMTDEQKREYDKIIYHSIELHHREYSDIVEIDLFDDLQDFYCKNHLDYRGLIPKGLAIDATDKNIY